MDVKLAADARSQLQAEIGAFIERMCPTEQVTGIFPGIAAVKKKTSGERAHSVSLAGMALTVQGEKEVLIGDHTYRYDPDHFLVTTLQMPANSCVMKATPEEPYLAILIELDPKFVASVILDANLDPDGVTESVSSAGVCTLETSLLEIIARIVRLADRPDEAEFLLPLAKKELVYRLLLTNQGPALRQIAANSGSVGRVTRAIERLKSDFNQTLRMEDVARDVGMSISGFHHHFKQVTGMSPLQYQKEMRLREARRLMLSGEMDAASAGYEVGYDDPSHFSREYKKLFGAPPIRDIRRLRTTGEVAVPA